MGLSIMMAAVVALPTTVGLSVNGGVVLISVVSKSTL